MPPVVAAAVAAAVTGGVIGFTAATAFTIAAVALSAYSVASVLSQKIPSFPTYSQQISDRKIMIRSSNQTRTLVYGEVKVSGPLAFASISGDDNEFIHLVIPLASHEVNQIGDVYFNDELSSFYDQFATVQSDKIYYKAGGSDYKATINGTPYTESTAAALVSTLDALPGMAATQENISGGGLGVQQTQRIVLIGDSASDVVVITATTYVNEDNDTITAKVEKVTARFEPYRISKHLGSDTQSADADLVSEVTEWTTAHQLKGIAYLYVRLWWNQDVWITGIPNIAAIVQGKKVYDHRDSTLKYTNNWALCTADYLADKDVFAAGAGTDGGFQVNAAELDVPSIIAAANASDEQVELTTGTQNRYELDGVVSLDISPRKNLDAMVGAGAGTIVYTQGVFKLYAGVYTAPVKTLTVDDLAGKIKLRAKASRADSFNAVKGTFSDPEQFYEPVDFPPVTNALYETQDGSVQLYADIELGYTIDIIRAQRLAKIALEKSRQGITLNFPANLSALELAVNDVVRVDVDQLGWGIDTNNQILLESGDVLLLENDDFLLLESAAGKQFKIVQWNLNPDGSINLTLNEEASGIYDWNKGEETVVDLAPNTNLPDPFTIGLPSSLSVAFTNEYLYNYDGSTIVRTVVSWVEPNDGFIFGYELEFKRSVDAAHQRATNITVGISEYIISTLEHNELYDFRIRSVNINGLRSVWISIDSQLVNDPNADFEQPNINTGIKANFETLDTHFINGALEKVASSGRDKFVIVGWTQNVVPTYINSRVYYSTNGGITWDLSSDGAFGDRTRAVAGSEETNYVAIGDGGTLANSSNSGVNWTTRTSQFGADDIKDIVWGSSLWVAVGANNKISTSSDMITWTARTSAFSGTPIIIKVKYGNGNFVAISADKIQRSSDGISWTEEATGLVLSNLIFGMGFWLVDSHFSVDDADTWVIGPPKVISTANDVVYLSYHITGDDDRGSFIAASDRFISASHNNANRWHSFQANLPLGKSLNLVSIATDGVRCAFVMSTRAGVTGRFD